MNNLIGQTIGRYHIIEQLGQGGMATVYRSYDTRLKREVALKVIRSDITTKDQADLLYKRFEREAVSLAKLSHPNIVGVFDYGEHEGYPYLVMEFIDGGSLRQKMGGCLPWKDAVRILIPIANALEYAHKRKLVHRDIKPANILITSSDVPKLTDFGIAKILEPGEVALTSTGVGIGTPEYMSPEQGMGKIIDHRSDVYSLGVVLYEMVTGRKPYTADTPVAVMLKHIKDPLPRPKSIIPDLPEEVERVLFVALAKNPEDRYSSMESFAQAMERLLGSENAPAGSKDASTRLQAAPQTATLVQPGGQMATMTAPPQAAAGSSAQYPAASGSYLPPPVMNYPPPTPSGSYPGAPQTYTAPLPAKRSNWGLVMGIGGVIVVLLCLLLSATGAYFFVQDKQNKEKTAQAEARRATQRSGEKTSEAATEEALRDLTVVNDSNINICSFYLADSSSGDRGDEMLGGNIIYPGSSYTFDRIAPGKYDFIAQDCSDNIINIAALVNFPEDMENWTVVSSYICGDGSCDPGEDTSNCPSDCGSGTVAVNIYNQGSVSICYVYYGPPYSSSLTTDMLGSSTVPANSNFTAYIPAGDYAIQANDCNGNIVYTQSSMAFYSDVNLTLNGASTQTGSEGSVNATLHNQTDVTICYWRYSTGGASSWEGDLLGSTTLGAYSDFTAQLAPGTYDLAAVDCNQSTMLFESYVSVTGSTFDWYVSGTCGDGTCDGWENSGNCSTDCGSSGGSGTVSLTLYNQTSSSVCYVYYSPPGASSWTADLLGSSTLPASSSFTAYVAPGSYTLQAEDCSHNIIYSESNVSVYSSTSWYIY